MQEKGRQRINYNYLRNITREDDEIDALCERS